MRSSHSSTDVRDFSLIIVLKATLVFVRVSHSLPARRATPLIPPGKNKTPVFPAWSGGRVLITGGQPAAEQTVPLVEVRLVVCAGILSCKGKLDGRGGGITSIPSACFIPTQSTLESQTKGFGGLGWVWGWGVGGGCSANPIPAGQQAVWPVAPAWAVSPP